MVADLEKAETEDREGKLDAERIMQEFTDQEEQVVWGIFNEK